MPTESDIALVFKLNEQTNKGQIDWQPTAISGEFAASFAGKYTVTIGNDYVMKQGQGRPVLLSVLKVKNAEGAVILRIDSEQDGRLPDLHELARRRAMKVDEAVADLLKELDKPRGLLSDLK